MDAKRMNEWQPIETAPKDGTFVLCCDLITPFRNQPPIMFVGRWDPEHHGWCDKPWHQDRFTPTHWQPLPEPPR